MIRSIRISTIILSMVFSPGALAADVEAEYVTGTAFFYNNEGDMFTNRHVVERCDPSSLAVRLPEGEVVPATILAVHKGEADLAALRTGRVTDSFASLRIYQGGRTSLPSSPEDVFTAGFSYPEKNKFKLQMRWGQITGFVDKNRKKVGLSEFNVARIDADPGASGSAVLDYSGLLIGVVYARSIDQFGESDKMATYGYGRHEVYMLNNDAIVEFANENNLHLSAWDKGVLQDPVFILGHLQAITGMAFCRERVMGPGKQN